LKEPFHQVISENKGEIMIPLVFTGYHATPFPLPIVSTPLDFTKCSTKEKRKPVTNIIIQYQNYSN